MRNKQSFNTWITIYIIGLFTMILWLFNLLFLLINTDFKEPYNDEFIRIIGFIIPPLSWITVWF